MAKASRILDALIMHQFLKPRVFNSRTIIIIVKAVYLRIPFIFYPCASPGNINF